MRRVVLQLLANCDLRNTEGPIYTTVGDDFDLHDVAESESLVASVALSITNVLTHRRFRMYDRTRWTRAEECVCDEGLLEV